MVAHEGNPGVECDPADPILVGNIGGIAMYKGCESGNAGCVMVGRDPETGDIVIGDAKHPERAPFRYNDTEWKAFEGAVQEGQFNDVLGLDSGNP